MPLTGRQKSAKSCEVLKKIYIENNLFQSD